MAVSISLSITQNSQNISNNTSNVTVKVTASWTGGSNNRVVNASGVPQAKGWVKIDGTSYDFASTFNDSVTNTGSKVICTKTVDVKHANDGKKTLSCSASYTTGVSSGTVTASASKTLTTIPRESTLAAKNGTLGTSLTMKVTKNNTNYAHTIKATCGSKTTTLCDRKTYTDVTYTPPLDWASQNTTGTSVSVKYTITTYASTASNSAQIGTARTYTTTCSIPASVKPSCKVSVTDATSYYNTYGGYVKGYSKFKITVTPTMAYDSPITSYKTTANGSTYTIANFTTDVLNSHGSLTITAMVTDKRGRTSNAAKVTVSVLDYLPPAIKSLNVQRGYLTDGTTFTKNDQGDHIMVYYDWDFTKLNDKNSITAATLEYKKSSDTNYTLVQPFYINSGNWPFEADTGSSYDIRLTITDKLSSTSKTTSASTAFTIMHWNAEGNGMAIGKVSELPGVFDVGMQTRLLGGLVYPILEPGYDLDECHTPGFYAGENVSTYNYLNCPLTSGTFTLEVLSMGDNGQRMQRLTQCHIRSPIVFERMYYKSAGWGDWFGGWAYPTIGSEFAVYAADGTSSKPAYRKDGRLVEIRGIVKPVVDIAGSTDMHTIITVPEGYRPNSPVYVVCQGSGNCTWLLRVNNSDGTVALSRYRNGDATATASAGTWLPFQVTYLV